MHRFPNEVSRYVLPLLFVSILAACAPEPAEEFVECEPGVADLSRTATAIPVCP